VLVLTGAGDKSFVAGADINELATFTPLTAKNFARHGHNVIAKLQELPIVVKFGQPEINLGVIPGFGGTQRLPRLIGMNMAKEIVFTGKMISALEAEKIGLVNKVIPHDQLMEEVITTAKEIASKGKTSLRAAKQAINHGMNTDLATGIHIEIDGFSMCYGSSDAKEGTSAFLEKRKAKFKGSLKD
jgi:enoyl-CoA hydratase